MKRYVSIQIDQTQKILVASADVSRFINAHPACKNVIMASYGTIVYFGKKKQDRKKRLTMLKCDLKRVVCDTSLRKQWTQMFRFARHNYSRSFFERTRVITTADVPCF